MTVLVTGAAGFIGMHVSEALLARGETVVGLDDMNAYYDVRLKEARLARLQRRGMFHFERMDVADAPALRRLFERARIRRVVHLAAQAGVRHSIENPFAYARSNLDGTLAVLEGCRAVEAEHCVFASSSSVYGANARIPYGVDDGVDHPVSLYAATKKSGELMAHAYAHLYRIPVTALRFFTVYGPWGRPDMAAFIFTRKILAGEPIDVFNGGRHRRDFTYVDDIVEGVLRTLDLPAEPDPAWDAAAPVPSRSSAPFRIYNIGNTAPVALNDFIAALEAALGRTAEKRMLPKQPGDVEETYADIDALTRAVGFAPRTDLATGLARFVAWYRDYYGVETGAGAGAAAAASS